MAEHSERKMRGKGGFRSLLKLTRRMYSAALILTGVILIGSTGYWIIGTGRWSWPECAYMTFITISTVGYGETLPDMDAVPQARWFTVLLILLGSGTLLYFVSSLTAFIVEGDLGGVLKRNRMQRQIDRLEEHFIVCGAGRTGAGVIRELVATQMPFVVIDLESERIEAIIDDLGQDFPYVIGNTEDDEVLTIAGIMRARGLVAALPYDRDNLFLTLTARSMNDKLRIVAKALESTSPPKLLRAGADSVVFTTQIGAMRLCSELIRPHVVEFLDLMLRRSDQCLRVSQIEIEPGSKMIGEPLGKTAIAQAKNLLIMALRHPDGRYEHIPNLEQPLTEGCHLIVMAESEVVNQWQQTVRKG